MQWLFKSKGTDIPMNGVDWIVLTANAVGVAVVVLASTQANMSTADYAQTPMVETVTLASLN